MHTAVNKAEEGRFVQGCAAAAVAAVRCERVPEPVSCLDLSACVAAQQQRKDELEALEAIYGEDCIVSADFTSCQVTRMYLVPLAMVCVCMLLALISSKRVAIHRSIYQTPHMFPMSA